MATVSIILRKDRINNKGEAPINFCIIKDRKYKKISAQIKIDPKYWDEKKCRIKSNAPNSSRLNRLLTAKYEELQGGVIDGITKHKNLTVRDLKEMIYGQEPTDFFKFADEACEAYMRAGQVGTHDRSKSIIEKIKQFTDNQPLNFQDIDVDFLNRYERFCQTKFQNKMNTIHMNMKFIRKLFNDAYRLELIDHKDIPFNKYKMKTEKTQRVYLTEDELTAFENALVTPGTRMDLHKDMFVFACYAGGLRVSDVLQLTWENYDGENIHVSVRKTKSQLSFLLPDRAREIIDKYRPEKYGPTDYIFPMLTDDLKRDDLILMDNEISRATAYINKNLGLIAKKAKLSKHISFHISRHTWATRALTKGISIDKVSKILGHADISETQIYAKIINEELNKAMQVFNKKETTDSDKIQNQSISDAQIEKKS
ncbi:MAG TPA: site-specific integrase [Bacteroidales bacterium]|nr:site-specific integrase [Bacteroidales bacterium]